MSTYFIDLGFNWNARSAGTDANGTYYLLQWGIVLINPQAQFGTMTNLSNGDTFMFNIYDLTQLDSNQESPAGTVPTIDGTWLNCASASTTTPVGSGVSTSSSIADAQIGPQESGNSFIFAGANPGPVWPIVNQGSGTPFVATVQRPTPDTTPGNLNYFFGWQITVTSPGQTSMRFRVDPEMIVKPGG